MFAVIRRPDGLITMVSWGMHKIVQRHFVHMPAIFDVQSGWMLDVLQ